MITLQRSITFPPVRLKRIDEYFQYVARNAASPLELRDRGLDFGKGRGDITRFFERIGVVKMTDGKITLTEVGTTLVTLRMQLGLSVYHALFYGRVPQYKILIDVLKEGGGEFEKIHAEVNERLRKLSPTAWINKVALRALLLLGEDLTALKRESGVYSYAGDPVERALNEYVAQYGAKIGGNYYLPADKLPFETCAKREPPHDLYKLDINCAVAKVYNLLGYSFQ